MPEEVTENPEIGEREKYTDIVVVRPPKNVPDQETSKLVKSLEEKGFMPYVQPRIIEDEDLDESEVKWFPTDIFRDLGDFVLFKGAGQYEVDETLKNLPLNPQSKLDIVSKFIEFSLAGGHYLHLNDLKIFIYNSGKVDNPDEMLSEDKVVIDHKLEQIKKKGWRIYSVEANNILFDNTLEDRKIIADLDFWMSIFTGKDGKPHAIASTPFALRVPKDFILHLIPQEEASRGGCNIADLRSGKVMVIPNSKDAPTTKAILDEYSDADLIETPPGFLDGGGGPRCSISSIAI